MLGAVEYERPSFFCPLHRFMSERLVPPCVNFFLNHLAKQLEIRRHDSRAVEMHSWETAPKVDAQAERKPNGRWGLVASPQSQW